MDARRVYDGVRREVVGREAEAQLILATLGAGRDLLLEGPPGTSKSTILRAITGADNTPLHFVEGNADLTPAKLVGHHSPSRVLREDYGPENFVHGPLPRAMREGGFLYIEEFNRVPEDTLNALLTAMAERELHVPRVGDIRAEPGFRLIAAMNPFDNVGTARLGGAIADRLCRVRLDYQPEEEEREIVARDTGTGDPWLARLAVRAARLSREHPDLRMGASVRAATDFVLIAARLAELRGITLSAAPGDPEAKRALIEAAQTAFSIKVAARESSRRSADEIVAEVLLSALSTPPDDPESGPDEENTSEKESPETPRAGAGSRKTGASNASAAPNVFSNARNQGMGGEVYAGEEAYHAAARRAVGQRMYGTFAAEHPRLAERLDREQTDETTLEEALGDEPEDALELLGEMADLYDRADLRSLARRLARDLIVRAARSDVAERSGRGRLSSVPYRGQAAELDLERSMEVLLEKPHPTDEDLFVLDRRHRRRAYALILDTSGSMKGEALFHAALALAAFAVRVAPDPFAVIAFWREAAVLKSLEEEASLDSLIDRVLSLPGRGLTNVGLGLRAGLDELANATTAERAGLLFGDGLQTTGEPAEPIAAAFPRLHVVATGKSEESIARCRELAALGDGRCAVVGKVGSIPEAVNECLAA